MIERLRADMKAALRARDSIRVSTLRMLLAEIHNAEISKKSKLEEAEIIKILKGGIKRRRESEALFVKGNRPDLAERENQEMNILQAYLPPQLSEAETIAAVRSAVQSLKLNSISDLGRLMKQVLAEYGDRVEGKEVQRIARQMLSAPPPSSGEIEKT